MSHHVPSFQFQIKSLYPLKSCVGTCRRLQATAHRSGEAAPTRWATLQSLASSQSVTGPVPASTTI